MSSLHSRRGILCLLGVATTGAFGGCSQTEAQSKPVDVLLQNDDSKQWQMTVAVERETGEEVFQTEETVSADATGNDLGEVLIDASFEGTSTDQFTIRVWLAGESAGTFDYKITCPDENSFSLLVEHQPYSSGDGEPVDYVPHRCNE